MIPEPDNTAAQQLARVIRMLTVGDAEGARAELSGLAGVTAESDPIVNLPFDASRGWPVGGGTRTKDPGVVVKAAVFVQDGFTCCYCGRWTIPEGLLHLVSTAFPTEFPYHRNWKKEFAARAYWDITTSLDHVHAVSTGGGAHDLKNMATACYRCQQQKGNRPVESLGWELRRDWPTWDGLTSYYEPLWRRLGEPRKSDLRWIRAFALAQSP